jgi:hypothetical protein
MIFWFYSEVNFLMIIDRYYVRLRGGQSIWEMYIIYINYKMIMRGSDMLTNFVLDFSLLNNSKLINSPANSAKSLPSRGAPLSAQCKSSPPVYLAGSLTTRPSLSEWGVAEGCGVNKLYATKASSSPKVLATKRIKEVSKCTDLVVWGINLGSTVGSVRLTKQEREMIKLPSFHLSVIIGLILSVDKQEGYHFRIKYLRMHY